MQRNLNIYRKLSSHVQKSLNNELAVNDELINIAIKAVPTLESVSRDFWDRSHSTFHNHGVNTQNFLKIITGNPSVLTRHPKQIINVLENWRSCQFGEYHFHLLLAKHPQFMDMADSDYLLHRFTYLKELACTNKNVWRLLMNSPNLIKENQQGIEDRYQYLTETMRLEIPEIVKSEVFSKSLEQLKTRHVFLDRLGLFVPRSIRANPDEPTKNPRLYQIIDSSDKSFSTKIARVTLFEWEVFQEIYKKELDGANDGDEEEGDDLDSDEEE